MTNHDIKLPPHDLNAEKAVLGCMLMRGSVVKDVRSVLPLRDLYADVHQTIYRTMLDLDDAGGGVDIVLVAARLQEAGKLADVGGLEYLGECMEVAYDAAHVVRYAEVVVDCANRRRTIAIAEQLANEARDGSSNSKSTLERAVAAGMAVGPCERQAIIKSMADIESVQLEWVWPGRIPLGKLTLLCGDPGLGKSFLTMDITARITRGEIWPDGYSHSAAGSVMVFNAEDDVGDTIRPRLEAAGADVSKVFFIEGIVGIDHRTGKKQSRGFSLELDLPYLEKWLESTPDARLIVIDPISAFCGSTDSHKNADVRAMLVPLAELASKYGIAILLVTHLSKGNGGKAVYRAMGSLAFAAAARAVWSVNRDLDDDERRLLLPVKMNLCRETNGLAYRIVDGRIHWEETPIDMTADDYLCRESSQSTESATAKSAREEATDWLRDALAGGERPSKELLADGKECGHSEKTLRRAFSDMHGKPQKSTFTGGWVWALPSSQVGQHRAEDAQVSHTQNEGTLASSWASSEVDFSEVDSLFGGQPA